MTSSLSGSPRKVLVAAIAMVAAVALIALFGSKKLPGGIRSRRS